MKTKEINTREAAEILGCSTRTVLRMVEDGQLEARKLRPGRKSVYLFNRADVEALRDGIGKRDKQQAKKAR